MNFVVRGTFKVTREQVANTLWHAFTGELSWFQVLQTVSPRQLRFRSLDQRNPVIVELRLDLIPQGLEVLASYYPRHFADLVNDNADSITADALLQCCLFGEIIYG